MAGSSGLGAGAPSAANGTMPIFGSQAPAPSSAQSVNQMASRGGTPVAPQMQQSGPTMAYGQPGGMMQRPSMMPNGMDMIRRQAFNPMMGQMGGYGGPRAPQIFQPNLVPQVAPTPADKPQAEQRNDYQDWQGGMGWSNK